METVLMEVLEKSQVIALSDSRLRAMEYGNDDHGFAYSDFLCPFLGNSCSGHVCVPKCCLLW